MAIGREYATQSLMTTKIGRGWLRSLQRNLPIGCGGISQMYVLCTMTLIGRLTPPVIQDRTHPPEYYNPHFGVEVDHGTVSA
jgi:hypothetical protein